MKFATKNPFDIAHLITGMLLHYLGKLKMQIFCRYSADMEENVNKLHFIVFNFVIHSQILIFSVFRIAGFPHTDRKIFNVTVLVFFIFAINVWHRKFVKADVTAVFVKNRHSIQLRRQDLNKNINTLSIHSYTRRGIKIGALKMQFAFFPYLLNNCRKFKFLIS